ncbi:hypothetical protein ACLKA7_005459, partial [Drosophila subpalustris]
MSSPSWRTALWSHSKQGATPPPSSSLPELPEQSNMLITNSSELAEIFRSLSFPMGEQTKESKSRRPQQRMSTLSDQPWVVYFLSPPPHSAAGYTPSDTSTVSLDVVTTLPVPQQQQQQQQQQHPLNISPKPEIILDSTLSPVDSGNDGDNNKDVTSPLLKRKDSSSNAEADASATSGGRQRCSILTGYEGIQTVRKRQASVVTYDVNVINFSQEHSDSRSYIPMGRVSTSST